MIAPIMRDGETRMLDVFPCGGTSPKPVHFEAMPGSKNNIGWTVIDRADNGNCTMQVSQPPDFEDWRVLYPLDGSADDNGKFPCGRDETPFEGKQVRFPKDFDCENCLL